MSESDVEEELQQIKNSKYEETHNDAKNQLPDQKIRSDYEEIAIFSLKGTKHSTMTGFCYYEKPMLKLLGYTFRDGETVHYKKIKQDSNGSSVNSSATSSSIIHGSVNLFEEYFLKNIQAFEKNNIEPIFKLNERFLNPANYDSRTAPMGIQHICQYIRANQSNSGHSFIYDFHLQD